MPIVLLIISIIILDQLSKYYIQQSMQLGMSIPVWDGIFHITYILNPGAAFGILENQRVFFLLIAGVLILSAIVMRRWIQNEPPLMRVGIGMLIGGAVGNVIDRAIIGSVVDFLDFRIWPIFNIADIFIVSGVGLMTYMLLKSSEQTER